jgi:hypothetical protein
MHISTLRAETGLSLRVRAKNATSVGADIQTGADPGLSLQRGRQHRAQCVKPYFVLRALAAVEMPRDRENTCCRAAGKPAIHVGRSEDQPSDLQVADEVDLGTCDGFGSVTGCLFELHLFVMRGVCLRTPLHHYRGLGTLDFPIGIGDAKRFDP